MLVLQTPFSRKKKFSDLKLRIGENHSVSPGDAYHWRYSEKVFHTFLTKTENLTCLFFQPQILPPVLWNTLPVEPSKKASFCYWFVLRRVNPGFALDGRKMAEQLMLTLE